MEGSTNWRIARKNRAHFLVVQSQMGMEEAHAFFPGREGFGEGMGASSISYAEIIPKRRN